MEKVLEIFNINEEEFEKYNSNTDKFIKNYLNDKLDFDAKKFFGYLDKLDPNINQYIQFGADKCSVDDFIKFCEELDVDLLTNINEHLVNIEEKLAGQFYKYDFYNRDKTLTFSFSSKDFMSGYLHYFGLTGERTKVLHAFEIFNKRSEFSDICWGGRDFI
jgi:hypothetical protein